MDVEAGAQDELLLLMSGNFREIGRAIAVSNSVVCFQFGLRVMLSALRLHRFQIRLVFKFAPICLRLNLFFAKQFH